MVEAPTERGSQTLLVASAYFPRLTDWTQYRESLMTLKERFQIIINDSDDLDRVIEQLTSNLI